MKFQLLYSFNSKSSHIILEAPNFQTVKNIFNSLIVGELLEIREYEFEDNEIKKDDKDYIHSATFKISTSDRFHFNSFKIPKIKKNLKDDFLISTVRSFVKINHLKPENVLFTKIYK